LINNQGKGGITPQEFWKLKKFNSVIALEKGDLVWFTLLSSRKKFKVNKKVMKKAGGQSTNASEAKENKSLTRIGKLWKLLKNGLFKYHSRFLS